MNATADKLIELARLRGLIRPSDLKPLEIPRVSLTRAARSGQLERAAEGLEILQALFLCPKPRMARAVAD